MKRNNMFMLSYIVFIFICFTVRICCEYPMWNTLVSAISISSGVFAFADFYSGKATAELDAARITKDLFNRSEKLISDRLQIMDMKLNEQLNSKYASQLGPECHITVKSELKKLNNENAIFKSLYEENFKRNKKYCKYANILNFLGYLSFFITLVFQTISSVLSSYLDLLSVFAFGLILLTQYMTGCSEEKMERQRISATNVHDAVKGYLEAQEEHVNTIRNLSTTTSQEVVDHAD